MQRHCLKPSKSIVELSPESFTASSISLWIRLCWIFKVDLLAFSGVWAGFWGFAAIYRPLFGDIGFLNESVIDKFFVLLVLGDNMAGVGFDFASRPIIWLIDLSPAFYAL